MIHITSHQIPETSTYPLRHRDLKLVYDGVNKRVLSSSSHEYKTYIRRYDIKEEYMIRGGEFPTCKRAYLREDLPLVNFGNDFQETNEIIYIENVPFKVFLKDSVTSLIIIYVNSLLNIPFKLIEETVTNGIREPLRNLKNT